MKSDEKVHIVLGNESCDLDSCVSAIVFAFMKTQSTLTLYHPMINCKACDIHLHNDVTYVLKKFSISLLSLTFRDDFDLLELHNQNGLLLHLVDHNQLPMSDSKLDSSIVMVIDHHLCARQASKSLSMTLERVGSCCTLIGHLVLEEHPELLFRELALLLLQAIVLDTYGLNRDGGACTSKDETVASKLLSISDSSVDVAKLYLEIKNAKSNVSAMSSFDIIRKDLKFSQKNELKVAVCSIPLSIEILIGKDDFNLSLNKFIDCTTSDVVIFMSLIDDGMMQRQLSLTARRENTLIKISKFLESQDILNLQKHDIKRKDIISYQQMNVKASRKVVLPLIEEFLNIHDKYK